MGPNRYFGKAAHMSAELKRVQHRVRQAHEKKNSRRFADDVFEVTRMDKEGRVTVTDRVPLRVMSPRRRHELANTRPKPYMF